MQDHKSITTFRGTHHFLGNFFLVNVHLKYPANVGVGNAVYRSVEHAFQAAKTLDNNWRRKIWSAKTPAIAKQLGRLAPLRDGWPQMRLDVMLGLLREKFNATQDTPETRMLRTRLLATEDALLVEGNTWHDNFWGSCTCSKCGDGGDNHLGKLLMQVRGEVR